MGLWLIQECRRYWQKKGSEYSYADLTQMAAEAVPFGSLILPQDTRYLAPGDIPARIRAFCQGTSQRVPQTRGEILRCALEGLAMEYRWVAEQLVRLSGRQLPVIHIIGGGSRNELLNQFTVDATGRTVVAGPVEATAIGNLLVQAITQGLISSLNEGRKTIARSFELKVFEPHEQERWNRSYEIFGRLKRN
jgi:rhamnulokinase